MNLLRDKFRMAMLMTLAELSKVFLPSRDYILRGHVKSEKVRITSYGMQFDWRIHFCAQNIHGSGMNGYVLASECNMSVVGLS